MLVLLLLFSQIMFLIQPLGCNIINNVELSWVEITQPTHCLHHLLPPKTSMHCPYSFRKRQHYYQLPHVEYSQYNNSFITCFLFNFWWLWYSVMVICSTDDEFGWLIILLLDYHFFAFSMCLSFFFVCFYRAMHFSAKHGLAIACRLSVCLSLCLSDCDGGLWSHRLKFFENNFMVS